MIVSKAREKISVLAHYMHIYSKIVGAAPHPKENGCTKVQNVMVYTENIEIKREGDSTT